MSCSAGFSNFTAAAPPRPAPALPYRTLPHSPLLTEFLAVFEEITKEIVDEVMDEHEMIDEAKSWVNRMIRYSVPGGKLNRGLQVVHSLQALAGDKPISPENLKRAAMLGWCIEWVCLSGFVTGHCHSSITSPLPLSLPYSSKLSSL